VWHGPRLEIRVSAVLPLGKRKRGNQCLLLRGCPSKDYSKVETTRGGETLRDDVKPLVLGQAGGFSGLAWEGINVTFITREK